MLGCLFCFGWFEMGCVFRYRSALDAEVLLDHRRFAKAELDRRIVQAAPLRITRSLREDLQWLQARLLDYNLVLRGYFVVFTYRPAESALSRWGYASMVRAATMYAWIAKQLRSFLALYPPSTSMPSSLSTSTQSPKNPNSAMPTQNTLRRQRQTAQEAVLRKRTPQEVLREIQGSVGALEKQAYKMLLMTLFVGFFFRHHLPKEPIHRSEHNRWLRIAAQQRTHLAQELGIQEAQHKAILGEVRQSLRKILRGHDPRGFQQAFEGFVRTL